MKKISTRQIIVFYFIYSFAIKFLMLPHFLSQEAGRDSWISALLGSLLELALLFIVTCYLRSSRDIDLYSNLKKKVSSIGAKAIFTVLFAFFLLQLFITLKQTSNLLSETLYENLAPLSFALPMLILGIAFCYAPTRSIFRSGEIFYVLIIAALALSLLPALNKLDPSEVLPVFDGGISPIIKGLYQNLIYFESAAILLLFGGDIKQEKNFQKTFMLWAIIGAAVFVAFVFMYYSLFGPLTSVRPFSIINITQQSSYITQNGRLEWIIVCIWLVLLLLRFGLTFYACFASLRYITHVRFQPAAIAFPLAAVIYVVNAYLVTSLTDLNNLITALLPFILAAYLFIPIIALFGIIKAKGGTR